MLVRNHACDQFVVGWMAQRHPPRDDGPSVSGLACSFIVKGTFRLLPDAPANPWPDGPEPLVGDMRWPDAPALGLAYPSDFVPWKPRGEWIVVGQAHPPTHYQPDSAGSHDAWRGGADRRRFLVHAAVGEAGKRLEVWGERHWRGRLVHLASQPAATRDATPISYALAWGGPRHRTNPIGTGYGGGPLPNFERPGEPTETYRDHRPAAGFAPVPADWPQRADLGGSHDQRWLATRWPWLPDDIDYRHFLATPPDQWIDGFFRGDEPVTLVNIHPAVEMFTGFLPGIRPRLAILRRPFAAGLTAEALKTAEAPSLEEVPLSLDTVWIDGEREKLVLVWRGLAAIASPKMSDIAAVTLAAEPLDGPLAAIESFIDLADLSEATDGAGPTAGEEPVPAVNNERADSESAARTAAIIAIIEEAVAQVDAVSERLETAGLAPRIEAAARSPSLAEVRTLIEQLAAAQGPNSPAAQQLTMLDDLEAVQATGNQLLAAFEAEQAARQAARDSARTARLLPRLPDGRVDVAEASRRGWQTLALAGTDLAGLDLSGADLAATDLTGTKFTGANLSAANLSGARLAGAGLAAANLTGANLVAVDFGKADLSRANFSTADLSHADLTAAVTAGVNWQGCRLSGAKLTGLDLTNADFSGCVADHADFARANLTAATFRDCSLAVASFAKARLVRTTFSHTILQWAAFTDASAITAAFTECDLTKVRGGAGDFRRATFSRCHGEEVVFDGARLDEAVFTRSDLPRPRFAEAVLTAAAIDRCDLREGVFEDASLADAVLSRCNLFEAIFDRADLTGARLEDSNAYGSGFWDSVVERLVIANTIVAGTRLHRGTSR